ncbi:hypothetical protein [Halorubrum aethiopicum]|uniref:hypothetical protein n=1 Tax=Halorubrum aethiopicum TaxID=1758255 RepID=UPI000B26322B|nr:hypothetical protein [Halorubrum aethiopicum]
MFPSFRENGPAILVPAAWLVAASAVLGVVGTHALFVAHVVMSALLVAFLVGSWDEMGSGALRVWRLVVLAGTPATLAGVVGFLALDGRIALPAEPLLAVALYGWILLPAAGLADTGRRVERAGRAYGLGATCCVAGAVGVAVSGTATGTAAGLAVVGVGQTIGIVAATVGE